MKYLLLLFIILTLGCGHKLPDYTYTGTIIGYTPKAHEWTMLCVGVKECMDINTRYPFPRLRVYPPDTTFNCGGYEDAVGCYRKWGRIDVPENASDWLIKHECVHHWLKRSTGDLDQKHKSEFFNSCT